LHWCNSFQNFCFFPCDLSKKKRIIWCNFHKMKKKLDYLLVCLYCFTGSSPQSYCHKMKKKLDYYLCLVNKKLPQFCSSPKGKKKREKKLFSAPFGRGSQLLNEQSLSQFTKKTTAINFCSCEITSANNYYSLVTITDEPWCTTGHIRLPLQNICQQTSDWKTKSRRVKKRKVSNGDFILVPF